MKRDPLVMLGLAVLWLLGWRSLFMAWLFGRTPDELDARLRKDGELALTITNGIILAVMFALGFAAGLMW